MSDERCACGERVRLCCGAGVCCHCVLPLLELAECIHCRRHVDASGTGHTIGCFTWQALRWMGLFTGVLK